MMKLVLWAVLVFLIVMFSAGAFFFRFAITRNGAPLPGKKSPSSVDLRPWEKYRTMHSKQYDWLKSQPKKLLSISSKDGLKLSARYFECESPERVLICVHGYRGQPEHDFAAVSGWLHDHHCNLLLIDQRASGRSEGKYVTFGAKEKNDICAWSEYLDSIHSGVLPIYLYGISMGASTVLMAADQKLPASVKGMIADCGFNSIGDIFEVRVKESFHLPPYPLMYFMRFFCFLIAGFRFRDADARSALAKASVPVLFLHGLEDHFVPPENSVRNYQACRSEKKIVLIPGAVHASSSSENPELYQNSLAEFFSFHEEGRNQ